MLNLLKPKILLFPFLIFIYSLSSFAFGEVSQLESALYQDKTRIVFQQTQILKNRLLQGQNELQKLQREQENRQTYISLDRVNKRLLNQARLDIEVAKSNLDSINIESSEAQQTLSHLEKEIQEIENQLNVYNVFGMSRNEVTNPQSLQRELSYQKILLSLEKNRVDYLQKLQTLFSNILQMDKNKYAYIDTLLKSQTVMQLKEQQAKSELIFQQEQSYWLQQQNILYAELNRLENTKNYDSESYTKLENQIFYANENVNFTYLQMLTARYQDQIQQMKVSISRSNSITLLNKIMDQAQMLSKQLGRLNELLLTRIDILEKRKNLLSGSQNNKDSEYLIGLTTLDAQYKKALAEIGNLNQELISFRRVLDQTLQQELSSRQGLPGFSTKAWLDLGSEILLVPSLTFQVLKSLSFNTLKALNHIDALWWAFLVGIEILWVSIFSLMSYTLKRAVIGLRDHEYGHINLKWLFIKTSQRCLLDIAIIGNLAWLFSFCNIPSQNFSFLINLALVWLLFKMVLTIARLCLVETVHDRAGHDVRLYHRLKWTFIVGGIITALTVFMHHLPLIFEVKDLFDRLFLLFLSIASLFLLKSWEVLPSLILPHVDDKHTYIKRVVRFLCVLIPFILLINSAIGLFGFVNFVQTISWYESIFLVVLISYLFVRGLLNDGMDLVSQFLISHVANGWLWREAFLKPLDKIFRMILFFGACVALFHLYGWDRQSPVVLGLTKLLHYHIVDMLNTSITLQSILELVVIVLVLFWAARWMREFMYRFLLSRTKDLGVRNSIAILSQYTLILVGIFICLRVLGIDFRALTAVAAAFAFGVGLGLRDLVNNFACGFLLLLERPLRVGDTVTINDFEGEVIHIGGRAVTIRTWDHMDVLVPNAEIFSKSFLNWTAKDHIVRTVISIKINRHDRPQDIQSVIYKVLGDHKNVLKDPQPEVFLKELTDGLTEFEVRYFVNLRTVKSRLAVRSEVLISIWEVFELHGIKPPYPHHEIFLKNGEHLALPHLLTDVKG